MAVNQKFSEYRVNSLPSSGLQAGDRYYLSVGGGKYKTYIVSDNLVLTGDAGSEYIEKDTMSQMRALSTREIWALENGYYKGVRLHGYYTKGDTPAPIEYILSNTSDDDDGGSVIDLPSGLKLEHSFLGREVSVKYFGVSNITEPLFNTIQINRCIQKSDSVLIDKDLDIQIEETEHFEDRESFVASDGNLIRLKSETTLRLEGTLRFLNNTSIYYVVLMIKDLQKVTITGKGTIQGNYLTFPPDSGHEHGHGVGVRDSQDCLIEGITVTECVGDGVYFSGLRPDLNPGKIVKNITVRHTILDGNSRQGISVISGDNCLIEYNTIINTGIANGTVLGYGIDIEPEWRRKVNNLVIRHNYFKNNYGVDIGVVILAQDPEIVVDGVLAEYNKIEYDLERNKLKMQSRKVPGNPATIRNVSFINNTIKSNKGSAISYSNPQEGIICRGNTIEVTSLDYSESEKAISIIGARNSYVQDNNITGAFQIGVSQEGNTTTDNVISGNNITGADTAFYSRNGVNLKYANNVINNVNLGVDIAGTINCEFSGNIFREVSFQGILSGGFNTNLKLSDNFFINTNKDYVEGESNANQGVVVLLSNITFAGRDSYVDISNNKFFNEPSKVLQAHIQVSGTQNRYVDVIGNTSDVPIIVDNAAVGQSATVLVKRKFGPTNRRPVFRDSERGYYFDTTTGEFLMWNGTAWENVIKKANSSTDSAAPVSETYTQSEVQAILNELRDLKTKLRNAGLLNS